MSIRLESACISVILRLFFTACVAVDLACIGSLFWYALSVKSGSVSGCGLRILQDTIDTGMQSKININMIVHLDFDFDVVFFSLSFFLFFKGKQLASTSY